MGCLKELSFDVVGCHFHYGVLYCVIPAQVLFDGKDLFLFGRGYSLEAGQVRRKLRVVPKPILHPGRLTASAF